MAADRDHDRQSFRRFLASPEAKRATTWQLATLADIQSPTPLPETAYQRILKGLQMARPGSGVRQCVTPAQISEQKSDASHKKC